MLPLNKKAVLQNRPRLRAHAAVMLCFLPWLSAVFLPQFCKAPVNKCDITAACARSLMVRLHDVYALRLRTEPLPPPPCGPLWPREFGSCFSSKHVRPLVATYWSWHGRIFPWVFSVLRFTKNCHVISWRGFHAEAVSKTTMAAMAQFSPIEMGLICTEKRRNILALPHGKPRSFWSEIFQSEGPAVCT